MPMSHAPTLDDGQRRFRSLDVTTRSIFGMPTRYNRAKLFFICSIDGINMLIARVAFGDIPTPGYFI